MTDQTGKASDNNLLKGKNITNFVLRMFRGITQSKRLRDAKANTKESLVQPLLQFLGKTTQKTDFQEQSSNSISQSIAGFLGSMVPGRQGGNAAPSADTSRGAPAGTTPSFVQPSKENTSFSFEKPNDGMQKRKGLFSSFSSSLKNLGGYLNKNKKRFLVQGRKAASKAVSNVAEKAVGRIFGKSAGARIGKSFGKQVVRGASRIGSSLGSSLGGSLAGGIAGKAMMALSGVAGGFLVAGKLLSSFSDKVKETTNKLIEMNTQQGRYSAAMSVVMANRELQEIARSQSIGDKTAKSAEFLVKGEQFNKRNTEDINIMTTRAQNYIVGTTNYIVGGLKTLINEPLGLLRRIVDNTSPKNEPRTQNIGFGEYLMLESIHNENVQGLKKREQRAIDDTSDAGRQSADEQYRKRRFGR